METVVVLDPIADLIGRAKTAVDCADEGAMEELDDAYSALVPQNQTLFEQCQAALQRNPEDLSPVS
jgi:hypothetical protein